MNSVVIGLGAALPKKIVTNNDLPESLNTSDEWIVQRTGIKQRYLAGDGETTASLALEASRNALAMAGVSPNEVDLIIVATVSGDYSFPATATIVQRELNATNAVAFDVSAACSGFIFALDIADSRLKLNKNKCALVIGAETFSRLLDWTDRSTSVLFGDGAGALLLRAENSNLGVQSCIIHSDGTGIEHLKTSGGISSTKTIGCVQMNGQEVFRAAIEKFNCALNELLLQHNMSINDIDLIVPHQANSRIIEKLITLSGIKQEKVLITVNKHANTSAASIPLAMSVLGYEIFKKNNVVLLSMGAGFTWGAALIKFNSNLE
ncbi:MAG: ketoacyl-ACP synthase III [Holosporaceae bacterium]|jgi:3-oxoacyl-[acyl-carrier-protein] synthase-3|nr:ketoacyl-ACP synthase III [Holosporaceae bacterium]